MIDDDDAVAFSAARRDAPPPITTRAPAPRPRRLSRRAIVLLAGGSALGLAAALGFALTSPGHRAVPQETVAVDHRQKTDLLATAPKDYGSITPTKIAALGPPPATTAQLGDQQTVASTPPAPDAAGSRSADNDQAAARQRQRQQRDSARSSKLFAAAGESGRSSSQTADTAASSPAAVSKPDPQVTPSGDAQDRKAAFVGNGTRTPTINSGQLTAPAGRNVVIAGSTIAAALITGLSSDLPGEVVAQVTEDVFDAATGRIKLVPQGTRLIGSYDAHVTYGQSRALVVWTRLILPDGRSLDLDRLIGTDAAGQSGFADRVDHHTGTLLKAGLLSTLFGVGANAATGGGGNNNDIAYAIRDSAGQSVERAGDKLVERQLDVQPTITIRPGARVRVLISRDLVLDPWPAG